MKQRFVYLFAAALMILNSCGKENSTPTPTPSKNKEEVVVEEWTTVEWEGFTYKIRTALKESTAAKKAMELLQQNLTEINELLVNNQDALKVMKSHPIWLEKDLTDGAAWYHVSKEWLAEQGYMTEKWHCVEICNYQHYVTWTNQNQPYMVLHELCHLYHNQGIENGYDNSDILAAYNHAVSSGMYINTLYRLDANTTYHLGAGQKAYCLNDCMEYFSEMCEAYWGENDYYPFDYWDLKEYDTVAFELMEKIWGARDLPETRP